MLDQDNNFFLISLSILITCLLSNVWILLGKVICSSLVGVSIVLHQFVTYPSKSVICRGSKKSSKLLFSRL